MRAIDADKLNFRNQNYNKSQMKAILDFIDNQPTISQWIPCSAKLPEDNQKIYASVVYQSGERATREAIYRKGHYMDGRCDIDRVIVAWMPRSVPKPYEEGENA